MIIICIILAIALCVATFFCIRLSRTTSDKLAKAEDELTQAAHEVAELRSAKTIAEERLITESRNNELIIKEIKTSYERQIAELKENHDKRLNEEREIAGERFKALASEILLSNSKQLDERSRASIETVLAPVKTKLEEFTKGFKECYDIENRDRLTLREEIKNLHELNTKVGSEAARLANALKGNTRVQGNWGEMVLKNILEHSGLEEGEWFVTQESTTTDDGSRLRPDAVIHCPGERDIIIDSKASLTSYLSMLDAEDEEDRKKFTEAHIRSVENHISILRKKEYQEQIGAKKGDFVFMFMPHEGAYLTAIREKPDLWQKAYDSHVIIVSPTHLVTVLRLVEQMWQTEKQTVNSIRIAEEGAKLLESLNAFLTDLSSVGDILDKAQKTYDSAIKRMTSGNNNVVRVAGRLKELGVKSKKEIPSRFEEAAE